MTNHSIHISMSGVFAGLSLLVACMATGRAENAPVDAGAPQPAPAVQIESAPELHRYAIGAEAGSAGFGPVFVYTASRHFTATLGYTWLSYSRKITASDADYDGKLKYSNLQALLAWHPAAGSFRLMAGVFIGNDKLDVTGRPVGNGVYKVGDGFYTASQIGTLQGQAKLINGVSPFVGLGWSKTPGKNGFGAFIDLGVLFISAPKANLGVTGPIATNAAFQTDLHKDEDQLNDDLKDFRYYPIIQAGILYRF